MTEKCPICQAWDLTKVDDNPDFKESFYSCGHHPKLSRVSINDSAVKINDSMNASKDAKRSISEQPVNVSDSINLLVTRFKRSPNITIEEKLANGIPSLQFSADRDNRFVINNSIVNIYLSEGKEISKNISPTSILKKIQEAKKDPSIKKEERSFLQVLEEVLTNKQKPKKKVSIWTRLRYGIARKKWVLSVTSTATPIIFKIIDIIKRWGLRLFMPQFTQSIVLCRII